MGGLGRLYAVNVIVIAENCSVEVGVVRVIIAQYVQLELEARRSSTTTVLSSCYYHHQLQSFSPWPALQRIDYSNSINQSHLIRSVSTMTLIQFVLHTSNTQYIPWMFRAVTQ